MLFPLVSKPSLTLAPHCVRREQFLCQLFRKRTKFWRHGRILPLPNIHAWDIISGMIDIDETNESQGSALCKSCGLCCTGHLFIWAKLRPSELDHAEALGMNVFRSDPRQRGFSHPCPLWKGQCTIHDSPHYPHICRAYKCRLLKEVIGENTSLPDALRVIEKAKEMIHELEALLPASPNRNFRERLVAHLEYPGKSAGHGNAESEFRLKAGALLVFYNRVFGVNDLIDNPDEK